MLHFTGDVIVKNVCISKSAGFGYKNFIINVSVFYLLSCKDSCKLQVDITVEIIINTALLIKLLKH